MINSKDFITILKRRGITFFTGVPDSLLKNFCAYLTDNSLDDEHIISVNEGTAISLAVGFNLATGRIPLIYMQNSGLGNAVNPLLSLADKQVYSIPMILLIGWRGEPGVTDEPQHVKQGQVTIPLLESMEIPYWIIDKETCELDLLIKEVCLKASKLSSPVAIVARKGTFEEHKLKTVEKSNLLLSREEAVQMVASMIAEDDIIVSTTGKISRELFEYRKKLGQNHNQDFLTVGSMGHASQIALGIAIQKENRTVYCFDGDGSALMHMGGIALVGSKKCKNYKHIIFNNGVHDSVGGQPTIGFCIDLLNLVKNAGYLNAFKAKTDGEIKKNMLKINDLDGPVLLEIQIKAGAREELIRPDIAPIDNKRAFKMFLNAKEGV